MGALLDEDASVLLTEAGDELDDEYGPIQTWAASIACGVYSGMSLEVTMECNVGGAYQGDIRNLATDRWHAMYPS